MNAVRVSTILLVAIASAVSCGPSATEGGFDSANPAAKMYAIEQAARTGDRTAIASIVEQLDSDDPAVRLLAIEALQRLTGQTYGYRHFDPPDVRREAIERWVQAVQPTPTPTSAPADAPPAPASPGHVGLRSFLNNHGPRHG
jgi:hypothetical protein